MSWEQCILVIREMLLDRGYEEWEEQENVLIFSQGDTISSRLMVYLSKTEKFNMEGVKYAIYQLQQHRLKNAIVVYQNIITSSAKKAMEHLQDYVLEMFEKKELQYNPTRHRLYCEHVKIDKNDNEVPKDQVVNLPVLLRTDVICRYFHFHRGDIIKIKRLNGSIAYRVVK